MASSPGASETYSRRLAVLGFKGVGKSSILQRLLGKDFAGTYEPTVVATYRHSLAMKGGRVRFDLEVVDTAGQDEYSRIPTEASIGVHGYILVYDMSSRASFDQLRVINDRLLEAIGADAVPRVLVANKSDVKAQSRQVVSDAEGAALASSIGCALVETSAKANHNVGALFETVLREVEASSGILADDEAAPAKAPGICAVL